MRIRLDRILSESGLATRSEARAVIRAGRVEVNGETETRPELQVETDSRFTLDGAEFFYEPFRYIVLNKPAGYLSATEDARDKTVLELLPEALRRGLFPAGRLDKDAEGLLLLTNDGALAHKVISPKSHVKKVYYAECDGELGEDDAAAFKNGIKLTDFTCLPAELAIISSEKGRCFVRVTVTEGKFHQVKRMLASRGADVTYLKRLSIGGLKLDESLETGHFCRVEASKIAEIFLD